MGQLNTADVCIILTLLISTGIGIYRGFIRETLTVITWIVAAVAAYLYGAKVGEYIVFLDNAGVRRAIGMLIIFMGVILIGLLVKKILVKAGKLAGVSTIDRIAGAAFGIIRGAVIVVLVLLVSSKNITSQDWYKKSKLMPKFAEAADATAKATPKSWKEDVVQGIESMTKDQPPAPVVTAKPTTVTSTPATTSAPAATPAPAATSAPTATSTSTSVTNKPAANATTTQPAKKADKK
ncbi:MAG TPA: CvpA family protein [Gammaproteobacteria bacterium]|nr:CvpA family protein [Gammaproteobacteria bacterium]